MSTFDSNALVPIIYQSPTTITEFRADPAHHTIWATQRQIAEVLGITVQAVGQQIKNFKEQRGDGAEASIKRFFIVAEDGKNREVEHYNMLVVAYVGFRAQATERTILFQDWAGEELAKLLAARFPKNDLSPATVANDALAILKQQVALMEAQQAQLSNHDVRITKLEANTQTTNEYLTVLGYFKYRHLPAPSRNEAQSIGQRATHLSHKLGFSTGKTMHQQWGEINTYHVSVLDQLLGYNKTGGK